MKPLGWTRWHYIIEWEGEGNPQYCTSSYLRRQLMKHTWLKGVGSGAFWDSEYSGTDFMWCPVDPPSTKRDPFSCHVGDWSGNLQDVCEFSVWQYFSQVLEVMVIWIMSSSSTPNIEKCFGNDRNPFLQRSWSQAWSNYHVRHPTPGAQIPGPEPALVEKTGTRPCHEVAIQLHYCR